MPTVRDPAAIPPFTDVDASKETSPVGITVPDVGDTVATEATEVPCVMLTVDIPPLIFSVVVVPLNAPTAVPHAVAKFATFTVPRPVAKSYPDVVLKAGVLVVPTVVNSTPFDPLVVLLQLGEFPAHGTELLPFVTSLNTHPAGGGSVGIVRLLELHELLAVWAIL